MAAAHTALLTARNHAVPGQKLNLADRPLWLGVIGVVLVLAAVTATILWLGPLPPRVVVMTSGEPGSQYDVLAGRYREALKASGIDLRVMPSAGGVENLRRLNDPRSGVAIGFAQGGLTSEAQSPALESLGTMFFEPFWFFSRVPMSSRLDGLRGRKVSIGPEGSASRALALEILRLNGLEPAIANFLPLAPEQSANALLRGEIDAAVIVGPWESGLVRRLLASSDANIVGFPRADAYTALYPYLTKLVLPAGVGNMATNRPPNDVNLIAPKASLIVRRDLHPAIQYLLLEAATHIHGAPNIFRAEGQFPAAEAGDLPLSSSARQFHKTGTPLLQRHLPYWLAALASRLLVLLIPVVGIAYPLLRFAPALYAWSMRWRIISEYRELKIIEAELERGVETRQVLEQLAKLNDRASHMRVHVTFAPLLYRLRSDIALVQSRVSRGTG